MPSGEPASSWSPADAVGTQAVLAIWSTSTGYRSCTVGVPVAVERVGGDGRKRRGDVGEFACTLWSSVAPQNACHQPPPWSRSGWTRPSATERCASSTRAKIARALPPATGSAGGAIRQAEQLLDVQPSGREAVSAKR